MLLTEVYNLYSNYQMVLSLGTNADTLVTEEINNPNSKFCRCSRIRLGLDFEVSGYITKNNLIHTNQIPNHDVDVIIFRTYRGDYKADYLLYLYKDYKILETTRKAVKHRRIIEQTDRQMSIKDFTKPAPGKKLTIKPCIDGDSYYIRCKHDSFAISGEYCSPYYANTMPNNYLGYYAATLFGLKISKKYPDKINEVIVDVTQDGITKGVGYISDGKWRGRNDYTKDYYRQFKILKQELQGLGISIRFLYEEDKN